MSKAASFQCTECGWNSLKWVGRCGECQAWGTVIEAATSTRRPRVGPAVLSPEEQARPISELNAEPGNHVPTGIKELDRVLGGGIVPGASILVSGEPGVGKSTLLLNLASQVANSGSKTLYASAEESGAQVRLRAERTGALSDSLFLASTTDLATILGQVEHITPSLMVVDSVQTIQAGNVDSLAGGPAQVREVTSSLIRVAKEKSIAVVIVGHVTKDGQIAGPRTLEHLVDIVCHFEGDRQTSMRFIRALKNRFGPTDEVGCFEMTETGIQEVPDPSSLFRSANSHASSGTCTTIALEGRRALPVEIQGLVVPTSAAQPRRVVNGVDSSRVAMILAVLERRVGLKLSQADVYISTVGGIRITEPAADLAIALAVSSASTDVAVGSSVAAVGEISLSGEIRRVTSIEHRQSEAGRLGFDSLLGVEGGSLSRAIHAAIGDKKDQVAPF